MSNGERKIVSTHIPKTGGVSLVRSFDQIFGKENVLAGSQNKFHRRSDYPFDYNQTDRIRSMLEDSSMLVWLFNLIYVSALNISLRDQAIGQYSPESYGVVHGHFGTSEMQSLFDNPINVVVFREPFDRLVSQYKCWERVRGRTKFLDVPFDAGMGFDDYMHNPVNINRQIRQIGDFGLDEFDVIGTTNRLPQFVRRVASLAQDNGHQVYMDLQVCHANRSGQRQDTDYSIYLGEFNALNRLDNELYAIVSSMQ